jgi:hypothetical protein
MWEGMSHGDFTGRGCGCIYRSIEIFVSIGTAMFIDLEDILVGPVIRMS